MSYVKQDYYTEADYKQYERTISNGETRIPICILIDVSQSMNFSTNPKNELNYVGYYGHIDGANNVRHVEPKPGYSYKSRIDEVKRVLGEMIDRMKEHPILANAAIINIVTFSRYADNLIPFSDVRDIRLNDINNIQVDFNTDVNNDNTCFSNGIEMALERLNDMAHNLRNAGNESYRPVLIIMTDGNPTDEEEAKTAIEELYRQSKSNQLNVVPIAIGGNVNEDYLRHMNKDNKLYHMTYYAEFDEVFKIITTQINRYMAVISVDQNIMEENEDQDEDPNLKSSSYGETLDSEDLWNAFDDYD